MRIIPWSIGLLLCLFHLSIVVGYTGLVIYTHSGLTLGGVLYWLLVLSCGLYLVLGVIKPGFRKSRRFTIGNIAILVPLCVVLLWLFTDSKPLTEDYTSADIRTQANGSYQYLKVFNQSNSEELERIHATLEDRDQVEAAWRRIAKYRRAVDALNGFDIICDLPPNASLDVDMPFLGFSPLRKTADIYHRYLVYKVEQGQGAKALEDVSRFYGFTRKTLAHATILIHKMVFLSLASKSYDMAYDVIGNSRCDMETIEALRLLYTPLQPDEFGLERVLIGEYLFMRNTMQQQVEPDTFLAAVSSLSMEPERPSIPLASRFVYYVGFKPNMSQRDMKHAYDLIIGAQKSTPPDYSAAVRYAESYSRHPQLRNMAGWVLNSMAMPDFTPYSNRIIKIKIQSDLLAIALHKKVGRSLEIKDYYTNGPCRYVEEKGVMRHPGPDGLYHTDDDVILGTLKEKS